MDITGAAGGGTFDPISFSDRIIVVSRVQT
jgi:hypothetical protein